MKPKTRYLIKHADCTLETISLDTEQYFWLKRELIGTGSVIVILPHPPRFDLRAAVAKGGK